MRYYARLLGATFCSGPPGIRGLVHSPFPLPSCPPPDLSNMTVNATLAHSWDSGCLLPQADIPSRLPWPADSRLRSPGPVSCSAWRDQARNRGSEVGMGTEEREGENKRAHLNRYFLSLTSPLVFSLLSERLVPDLPDLR